jgi:anti-anti-sigma factor
MTEIMTNFKTEVRHSGEISIIDLYGEINATADQALSDAYLVAESSQPQTVLLNFAEVDYINSTGIALIVGLLARARKSHRQLITCGLSEHYQEIFRITRLSDFMTMFADEKGALQGEH